MEITFFKRKIRSLLPSSGVCHITAKSGFDGEWPSREKFQFPCVLSGYSESDVSCDEWTLISRRRVSRQWRHKCSDRSLKLPRRVSASGDERKRRPCGKNVQPADMGKKNLDFISLTMKPKWLFTLTLRLMGTDVRPTFLHWGGVSQIYFKYIVMPCQV